MGKTIFKIPQSRHPFVGLGEGFIIAENGRSEPKITVTFPSHSIEITTITGEKAKEMIAQMNSDDIWDEDKIEYAKGVVCKILDLDLISLSKSKKTKCSFGRLLIYEYAHNKLKISLSKCAQMFVVNSNSPGGVHNMIKKLQIIKEKDCKYMEDWERSSYILFQKEIEQYEYTFEL